MKGIAEEVPELFDLQYDEEDSILRGHGLKLGSRDVYIGRLNAQTVFSIWASLQLELYYFANDDDERLSIQAHKWLLRNLSVQCAASPLGYAILCTKAVSIKL